MPCLYMVSLEITFNPENEIVSIATESEGSLTTEDLRELADLIEEDPLSIQSPADRKFDGNTTCMFEL